MRKISNDKSSVSVHFGELEDDVISRYSSFENLWMTCEYVFSSKNLEDFTMTIILPSDETNIAFKDLKGEFNPLTSIA